MCDQADDGSEGGSGSDDLRLAPDCAEQCSVGVAAKICTGSSHTRGEADRWSDVDFLVIEAEVEDRFEEMVRLTAALAEIR